MRNAAAFVAALLFAAGGFLINLGFFPAWVFVGGIVAGGIWAIDYVRERRHNSEYQEFAILHGWEYARRSAEYTTRFVSSPFGVGNKRHQTDVLRGTLNGIECATFTHHYEVDNGRAGENSQYIFQVTLVELPVTLPRLELIPESFAQRVAKTVGAMDIEFESELFNRQWRVRAADRKYAHDVLDPRMLERLIQPDAQGGLIRIEGGAIMTWQAGRRGVEGLAARLGVLTAIARRIPDHVLREYTERGLASHRGQYSAGTGKYGVLSGPEWAVTPGALTSGRYTGIGVDDDESNPTARTAR
jgi:hypothetical protein